MSITGKYVVYTFLIVFSLGCVFTPIKILASYRSADFEVGVLNLYINTDRNDELDRLTKSVNAMRGKLPGMGILYDKLYRLYPDKYKVTVETDIDDKILDAKLLSALGIMLNELVTNSLKHAFPETRTGAIPVELKSPAPDRVEFTYRDNGIGMPDSVLSRGSTGLGMMMIRGIAEQIGGTYKISRGRGTFISMVFKTAD